MASQAFRDSLYGDMPLESSRSEIRLLELLPCKENSKPIECCLIRTTLSAGLPFRALSYVWGDPGSTEYIMVNGIPVPVTINLASALRHARCLLQSSDGESDKGNFLWADALCINQEDLGEKSHQVALMGEIYGAAEQVVAWLGEEDNDIRLAVRTIEEIGAAMPRDFCLGQVPSKAWLDALSHVWSREEGMAHGSFNRHLEALEKFMRRSYWSRSWIVQEIVLARRDPVFMIGWTVLPYVALEKLMFLWDGILESSAIPYESRLAILGALSPKGSSLSGIYWLRNVVEKDPGEIGRIRYNWPKGILQMAADGMLATDPRDKVFAFGGLGLTSLPPDYTASVSHVYSGFTKEAIEAGLSSQVWQYSGVGLVRAAADSSYSLPSWIPDLPSIPQHQGTLLPLFCQEFAANKDLIGGQVDVDQSFHLSCSGYPVDSVSKVFERLTDAQDFVKGILEELKSAWSHQSPKYPVTPASALLRTLLIDCANMTKRTRLTDDKKSFIQFAIEFLRVFARTHGNFDVQRAITLPRDNDMSPLTYFHEQFSLGEPMGPMEVVQWPTTYQDIWHCEVDPQVRASLSYSFARVQSLFLTADGRLGSGPAHMQVGDRIFALPMCNVPLVLREVDGHYLLVGVCFVLGLMDGEVAHMVREEGLEPAVIEMR
ncbi:hypothetical protein LCI18_006269 [Fusarium solani-melongenae]|uniref:Uncharacterized protein n=1 Tax=Fusarium solani subsp. cucurbitae TaxID=2747967 RepID=A0ACD3Z256_FUSSC|nr:hypothetical protein LCI18_006269 [Fusarium solani-melongenae]